MSSGPVAVSVEGCQKLFHLFMCKRHRIQGQLRTTEKDGIREGGVRDQYFEANTELRDSAFSPAESAVVPFEMREGMEGEHTPETDLTRHHQVLEGGDKFEGARQDFFHVHSKLYTCNCL